MANIKLVGNNWEAEGIFDKTQNKTQKAINSEVVSKLSGIEAGAQVNRTYTETTAKPTANQAPSFGDVVTVSQVTQDAAGQISVTDRTITIPNSTASTSAAGLMSAADKSALDTAVTNIGTMSEMGTTATTLAGGIGELNDNLSDEATARGEADTSIRSILSTFTICKGVSSVSDFGNVSFNFSTTADVTLTPTSFVVPIYTKGVFITTGADAVLIGLTPSGKEIVAYRNGSNWVRPSNISDQKISIADTYTGATDINSIAQAAIARMQVNGNDLASKLFTFRAVWESGQPQGYFGTSAFNVICQFSSASYGYGLLLSDNAKNIASFRVTSGTATLFPIGDLQTYTSITPNRGDDIASSVSFVSNYCRKWGKIVKYTATLNSTSSSDVEVTHTKQIIKGLPKPDGALIFMCDTYRASSSTNDRKQYRVQLNTDGTITAYWDTVIIPKYGEALLIDIVYMSND